MGKSAGSTPVGGTGMQGDSGRPIRGDWDSSEKGTFNFKTSFVVGLFFGFFLLILTLLAGWASVVGGNMNGAHGARFGLVLGLIVGVSVLGLALRVLRDRIEMRSVPVYKGLWMALIGSAVAVGFIAFTPSLNYPDCPPGQLCTSVNR